jgi:hypothetical protein
MIINARSPYFITVNEASQVGSKVELFLSAGGSALPATATYTLSKSVPSSSQLRTDYNISQFIKEYIETISSVDSGNTLFANVRVIRYKETAPGSYSTLDTTDHFGVNGYTLYTDGYNETDASSLFACLANPSIDITYQEGIESSKYPYINAIVDFTANASSKVDVSYKDLNGRNEVVVSYDTNAKSVIKVPVRTTSAKFDNGNTVTLNWKPAGTTVDITKTFTVSPICEPKYTPVQCQFINRYGGWQFLTFFKAKSSSINVMGTPYNLLPDSVNYNPKRPQTASLNVNGKQSIKLNTGWVSENYSELIQDLLLSETVLLDDVPVEIKTQSSDIKTSLKDRNINYEMEFEYAFNLINNVI